MKNNKDNEVLKVLFARFLLAIFPVMGVRMYRVLVLATALHTGQIGGQHDRDDRTKDNSGDDIDFSQAVLDPDTGLMCVHNQGGGNLQKVTNIFFIPIIFSTLKLQLMIHEDDMQGMFYFVRSIFKRN